MAKTQRWLAIGVAATLLLVSVSNAHGAASTLLFRCSEPSSRPNAVALMIDVDSAFARMAPRWDAAYIGRLVKQECLVAEGRNPNAEWALVRYGNGKAWAHKSIFRANQPLDALPIAVEADVRSRANLLPLPAAPQLSAFAKTIYRQAAKLNRDPRLFTIAGECNSEGPLYLDRFAAGAVDLTGHPSLSKAANHFSGAFGRTSMATLGGYNTASMLDPMWSDPQKCQSGEGPFACELRTSRASVVFIALGTGDQHSWQSFEERYDLLIRSALSVGALPVLVTKADALETEQAGAPADYINSVIRRLAAKYQVPLMDLANAVRTLPGQGLVDEPAPRFHVSPESMDMRLLMTLQILDALMR